MFAERLEELVNQCWDKTEAAFDFDDRDPNGMAYQVRIFTMDRPNPGTVRVHITADHPLLTGGAHEDNFVMPASRDALASQLGSFIADKETLVVKAEKAPVWNEVNGVKVTEVDRRTLIDAAIGSIRRQGRAI